MRHLISIFLITPYFATILFSRYASANFLINGHEEHDGGRVRRSNKPLLLQLPENYSIHQPPPLIGGQPVPVQFSILIFNIFDIKELQGQIGLEANLKIFWTDTRLANWTGNVDFEEGQKYTVLSPSLIKEIWHPDAFIDHMKEMSQPSLISKAASLRIYPDG